MDYFNELLYGIFDRVNEGVYILDLNKKIVYWNAAAERISGFSAKEVIGKGCSENVLVHIDGSGKQLCFGFCPVDNTISTGDPSSGDVFLHHKKGHRVAVHVDIVPIKSPEGRTVAAIEMFSSKVNDTLNTEKIKELVRLSYMDDDTAMLNTRYAKMKINSHIEESKKMMNGNDTYSGSEAGLGVLTLKVKNAEEVRLIYGKVTYHEFMKLAANTINANIETNKFVIKWGDGEILVLMQDVKKILLSSLAEKVKILLGQSYIERNGVKLIPEISYAYLHVDSKSDFNSTLEKIDEMFHQL